MAWTYWNWVVCNILIGLGIVLFIYLLMGILLWHFHQIFYSLIAKLFNISRCIIDVNHNIIRKNTEIYILPAKAKRAAGFVLKVWRYCKECIGRNVEVPDNITTVPIGAGVSELYNAGTRAVSKIENNAQKSVVMNMQKIIQRPIAPNDDEISSTGPVEHSSNQNELDQEENSVGDPVGKDGITWCCWPRRIGVSDPTDVSSSPPSTKKEEISPNHPAHPDHEREVLNVYGRFLSLNKKRNKFLIMTLSVIVISSVIIAGFQGCFLANITVYVDGACPFYGVMDCFVGSNASYFQCTPDTTVTLPDGTYAATCFRWIGRDISVADVMTQVGACTGLLTAFGSAVEVLIRLLLFVFQQRPSVATGIRRLMEKTVGINKITEPTRCCGSELPCHFGILNLRLYQRPILVIIFLCIYLFLPALAVGSIIVMSYFRISITALTYIVLITVVLICCLGLLWILWEEDEIGRVIPGGWVSPTEMSGTIMGNYKKWAPLLHGVIPERELKELHNFTDGVLDQLDQHTKTILAQLTKHTDIMIKKLAESVGNKLPITEVQELARLPQDISSKNELFVKQLKGDAQKVRTRKEAEKSKDLGSGVSRRS